MSIIFAKLRLTTHFMKITTYFFDFRRHHLRGDPAPGPSTTSNYFSECLNSILGDLRLRDSAEQQEGTASLTVVATDSGNPPKTASVPVLVHFPGSGTAAGRSSSEGSLLLAGLGAVLLVLACVIAFLVVYIYKA